MDRDLALQILDQLCEIGFTNKVYFHVLGEPLLHPDVFAIVNHAADVGMKPVIFTNGSVLTEKRVGDILSSKVSELVISMQTINRESYEKLRRTPFDWDTYLARIQTALVYASNATGSCPFRVSIGIKKPDPTYPEDLFFFEYKSNNQIKKNIALIFSRVEGIDWGQVFKQFCTDDLARTPTIKIHEKLKLSVKQIGNFRRVREREPTKFGHCIFFGKEFAVLSDGTICFCHIDYDGQTSIGNINNNSLVDIFSSSEFMNLFEAFSAGRTVPDGCRNCRGVKNV